MRHFIPPRRPEQPKERWSPSWRFLRICNLVCAAFCASTALIVTNEWIRALDWVMTGMMIGIFFGSTMLERVQHRFDEMADLVKRVLDERGNRS